MKRLFLVLFLVLTIFALQTQAKEMKAPQLFVTVDRICAPLTYVDNKIPTIYECFRKELTNPLNYTPGWSKYVLADIQLKPIGEAIEKYPINTTDKQSEKIAEKIAIPVLDKIYKRAIEEISKQPGVATTIIPASKLRDFRYE